MSLSSEELLSLLTEQLFPSRALRGLIEDVLPDMAWVVREEEDISGHLKDMPEDGDLPQGFSKDYDRAREKIGQAWTNLKSTSEETFKTLGSLFDQECQHALIITRSVPEAFDEVVAEWADMGNALIEAGAPRFPPTTNAGRLWRRARAEGFWGAVFESLPPDRLHVDLLPSGPLLDWGLARSVLVARANRQTPAGLPSLRPWLDRFHTLGQHMADPDNHPGNRWTCDPPRKLTPAANASDLGVSNVPDSRPIAHRRDDHWRLPVTKERAMEAWLAEIPPPPVHPATFDWTARLAYLKTKKFKDQYPADFLTTLQSGFDSAVLNRWLAGQENQPLGKTATDLMMDMEKMDLGDLVNQWRAKIREQRSLTETVMVPPRPRHRP